MKIYTHEAFGNMPDEVKVLLEASTKNLPETFRALASEMEHRRDTEWLEIGTFSSEYNPPKTKAIKSKLYLQVLGRRQPNPDERAAHKEKQKRWDAAFKTIEEEKAKLTLTKLGYTVTKKK